MTAPRANVVGLGLIGGSIGRALRASGWHVTGEDRDPSIGDRALAVGAIDAFGLDADAAVTFVATPVSGIVEAAQDALRRTSGLVTDVGSVKGPITAALDDPRFCGGHPMAGSERIGVEGADPDMFTGAVWVLTPTKGTPDTVFTELAGIVSALGAEVVALAPEQHDALVAVVSHVPHLTAATLMTIADRRAEDHGALLRLAAGGFRDMTRIASGHPAIWPDICAENRAAILTTLDEFIASLQRVRGLVADGDRPGLTAHLERARSARARLPVRAAKPEELAEVRVQIPDRPGAAAELFTLAAELGVNIDDFEVMHTAADRSGVAILLVDATQADLFHGGLLARRFKHAVERLA